MNNKRLIAITGGIGSGKSVISSILRINGYLVYDCDAEAKRLMNTSLEIKNNLVHAFGSECIAENNQINSKYLSAIVFSEKNALLKINTIVHPRVKEDIIRRFECCEQSVMFIETAILLQSNLLDIVSGVWVVTAPVEVCIARVMNRNNMNRNDVKRRIEAQKGQDYSILNCCRNIVNDDKQAILPQVDILLGELGL